MGNMSYCRFENTLADLRDCEQHITDDLTDSPEEYRARKQLIRVCQDIIDQAEDSLSNEI